MAVLSGRRGVGTIQIDDPQSSVENIEPRNEPHSSLQIGDYHN